MIKGDLKNDGKRILIASAIGAAVSIVLSAVLTMLLAALISSGRVGEGSENALCIIAAFIAAAIGALTARLKAKGAALLTGAGTAVIAIFTKLIIMLISDESSAIDSLDITIFLSILCAGLACGAISPRRKRRRRR